MTNDQAETGQQISRATRYRELLEKIDPSIKKRRLEEELDGRAQPDGTVVPGLREQLFAAVRQALAQDSFVERRVAKREEFVVDETTEELFDRDQSAAVYNQSIYWMQVEYLEGLAAETEEELAKLKSAGLPAGNGTTRAARRRTAQ